MRAISTVLKEGLRSVFELGQLFGVNILPMHFYSPVPNVRALRRDTHWRKPFTMVGVAGTDVTGQTAFLQDLCPPSLIAQWPSLDVYGAADREQAEGGGYGVIEAYVLHAFIRRHQPRRIVQVGCGLSTSVMLRAATMADYEPELICVEPYPSAYLSAVANDGRITLVKQPAELVTRETLTKLGNGDMLFVDSTHTVRPGSEVNRIVLDILPRLDAGVFVHFHDIYFPYDYQRSVMSSELFFNVESTLLHAFLINNAYCRIVLSLSMLHYAAPERMKTYLPIYDPQANDDGLRSSQGAHFPSATYLQTIGPQHGSHA